MIIHLNDYNPYKDLVHDDGPIINKAIKDLNKGDTLVIDDGEYSCSTIFLKSDIEIYLSKGARLKMVNNINALYDINEKRNTDINVPTWENCEYNGKPSKYFIFGYDIENVSITGYGVIDGNEEIFYGNITPYHIEGAFYPRVPLIYIENGRNLKFDGITLTRSAFWTLHLVGCDKVLIDSIKIKNNPIMTNCDGIDPDHSKNITIKNCDISCADDCIVIKNTEAFKKYGDSYNINVSNCILKSTSSAIKIGTETVSDFHDFSFKNIRIYDTNRAISIMNRDGSNISDLYFENIDIKTHLVSPIHWWGRSEIIYITNLKRNESSSLGSVSRIGFKSIKAEAENGIVIYGDSISKIGLYDINLKRMTITDWPHKDIDLRPSIYNVVEGEFHDLYSNSCKDIEIIDTNLTDIVMEG